MCLQLLHLFVLFVLNRYGTGRRSEVNLASARPLPRPFCSSFCAADAVPAYPPSRSFWIVASSEEAEGGKNNPSSLEHASRGKAARFCVDVGEV